MQKAASGICGFMAAKARKESSTWFLCWFLSCLGPGAAVASNVWITTQFWLHWLPSICGWCGLWLDLLGHRMWPCLCLTALNTDLNSLKHRALFSHLSYCRDQTPDRKWLKGGSVHFGSQFRRDAVCCGGEGLGRSHSSLIGRTDQMGYKTSTSTSVIHFLLWGPIPCGFCKVPSPKVPQWSKKSSWGGHFTLNDSGPWLSSDTVLEFPRCNVHVCACATGWLASVNGIRAALEKEGSSHSASSKATTWTGTATRVSRSLLCGSSPLCNEPWALLQQRNHPALV